MPKYDSLGSINVLRFTQTTVLFIQGHTFKNGPNQTLCPHNKIRRNAFLTVVVSIIYSVRILVNLPGSILSA